MQEFPARTANGVGMLHGRRAIALVATVGLVSGCTVGFTGGRSDRFDVGGRSVRALPQAGTTRVGVYEDQAGTCFGYAGKSSQGAYCMRAVGPRGWAVEVDLIDAGGSSVLLVAGGPSTTQVRVPRIGLAPLVVPLHKVPGISASVAAVAVDPTTINLTANGVTGYDAQGRLLGHTHDCEGLGGPKDCGPYDGLVDRTMKRPPA